MVYPINQVTRKMSTKNLYTTARFRRKKMEAAKYLGDACHVCKQKFPYYVYDFHHKDPTRKSMSAGYAFRRYSWERIKAELDDCMLLCANCHRIEHNKQYDILWENPQPKQDKKTYTCITCGCNVSRKTGIKCRSCHLKSNDRIDWPSDEDLAALVAQTPVEKLAKTLGVSGRAIKKRCDKRNIPTPSHSKKPKAKWPDDAELLRMVDESNYLDVARRLNVANTSVSRRCKQLRQKLSALSV